MVSVDRLVDVLYGEELPANPANAVQVLVSRLRRRLAPAGPADLVDGSAAGYRLRLGPDDVDAGRFAAAVAEARGRVASDPGGAADALGDALALWRGEPLTGIGADEWADAEPARLAELRWAASRTALAALLAAGRHGEAVAELEPATHEQPLRERLWAQLVLALYRCGRQADALRAFQDARGHLVDGLGIEPGAELRRLEAAVLAQDPSLDLAPARRRAPGRAAGASCRAPAGGRRASGSARGGGAGRRAGRRAGGRARTAALPRPLTACLGREG